MIAIRENRFGCSSSDHSLQRYRIKAQPYRTAPSCASPAPSVFYRKQAFTCSVYRKTLCFAHRAAFPASRRCLIGARKAALRQWTKGTFLRTLPGSYYGWVIAESYFRLAHSAPAPAHTPASRTTSDSLCGGSPCGVYSVVFNARCGFALPGTNAGTRLNPLPSFV